MGAVAFSIVSGKAQKKCSRQMIHRIYIDTSVLGGLFDIEFSDDTKPFFDRVEKGDFKIVYSEITNDELANALTE